MAEFNVKMTPDAKTYILSYWTENELAEELNKCNGDEVKLLTEVINKFFRERRKEGKDYDLIQVAKTAGGENYYKLGTNDQG